MIKVGISLLVLFFKWAILGVFFIYFRLFKQINVNKCPSSKQCWDLNPRPLEHESPPMITRPGLPPILLVLFWNEKAFESEVLNLFKPNFLYLGLPNFDVAAWSWAAAKVFPPRRQTHEDELAGISSGEPRRFFAYSETGGFREINGKYINWAGDYNLQWQYSSVWNDCD